MAGDRFDTLWEDKLKPWLQSVEGDRKKALRNFWTYSCLGAAMAIAALIVLGVVNDDLSGFVVAAAVPGVIVFIIGLTSLEDVRKRVKAELNTQIAEVCGMSYSAKVYETPRFDVFKSLGLLPGHTRRKFEDLFSGTVRGCDFELYEAHLEQRRRSGKRTYYVTVFHGALIRVTFPRRVEGVTVITRDQGWFNGLSALGRSFGSQKLERIGLVDQRFERAFEVYGSDQVLARYMVTPDFMEKLLALETALKGKKIRAAFDENSGQGELLIAVETGDLFEAGSMFKPLADQGRVMSIVKEIQLVTEIIRVLVERGETQLQP
ncbi:DUF3137 domain-containing protein [Maricaulis sp.]|uniref:DUF3137 domain-containing protein n=1 Tax=Maricaulis sp. TaxID=1486257 RepID=UPI00262A4676|nr:DUF3137 domain-containing protein [Maricaulis sp.]